MPGENRGPQFIPSGFFVLRTPLRPFSDFEQWSAELEAPKALPNRAVLDEAIPADRTRLHDRLVHEFSKPDAAEALFVGSPSLFARLDKAPINSDSDEGRKIQRALVRYFARMTGRATPFGLFAGCGVGRIGRVTSLRLQPASRNQRRTRLDMAYLCDLIGHLQRDETLRDALRYFPNSSLYRLGDRLHYAEWRHEKDGREHHLVVAEASDYLLATLNRARDGATAGELARTLTEADPDIEAEEALEFVHVLIDNQLLVSELEPCVTGTDPLTQTLSRFCEKAKGESIDILRRTAVALNELDAKGVGASQRIYQEIAAGLEQLPAKIDPARLFQVDMYKPCPDATLGERVVAEISRAVDLLHRTAVADRDRLAAFREAFSARYEQREVPLVEALDEESGIGFDASNAPSADASPLLAGLNFPSPADAPASWNRRDAYLMRKAHDALREGAMEIQLTQDDLKALGATDPLPLPDAFAVVARIAAASEEAMNRGEFRVLVEAVAGPSGANLLGRFCHGHEELEVLVREHLRTEEALRPEMVFAEIVHLPEGLLGNVLLRPVLREFEIPYLGRSGAPEERRIPLTDLLVSVRGDRVILRSAKLGREIAPRLTSAHNYDHRSLGVYRFLCSLQSQGTVAGLRWRWGALEASPFLPRVTVGRLVLSRARWLVFEKEIQRLAAAADAELFVAAQTWRAERELPRWIGLADADNELVVDLDNILSVETFIGLLKGRDGAVLQELFPPPEELVVNGPEGNFVHEIVVPFVRRERAIAPTAYTHIPSAAARRNFAPGGEWLSVKLYGGTVGVDRLLRELVSPLVEEARAGQMIDRWFFLRYADPDWHLRLRLHGRPQALNAQVLPSLERTAQLWFDAGVLWRVQLDTYDRELERYGGDAGMELSERLFHADSEAILEIVQAFSGDAGLEARWRLALLGIDRLMNDFQLDVSAKRIVIRRMFESLSREFRVNTAFRQQLGDKFRRERASLHDLLRAGIDDQSELAPGLQVFQERSAAVASIARELHARRRSGSLAIPVETLVESYIHMHVNRLLRSAHRAQELVIYFLLDRYYDSLEARIRGT